MDCCLKAHANAKAPWSCPCECHNRANWPMEETMDDELKEVIRELCSRVEEVLDNGDWPTEDHAYLYGLLNHVRDEIVHL